MPICPKCRGENPELGAKCPRDGYYYIYEDAIDEAEQDDWIGRLAADKYVILSLISEGGMGAVYRAMQLPVQREIAFKVLRAELQDSDQGQDRFAREARAVSKLSHPNIITMHDFGVDSNGHPFMAMEYAPGKSLADWIMQPGLKLDRIAHVFRQILSALSEAHNQGIVHRDLKPENLIVTRTGADEDYIKLLDFGIARMVHDGATRGLTKEGEVFGTPHYMAPEQAQGKKDIGPPADVYALGIMLYEMLVGQCPFDAPTPLSILYMHINDDLPELSPRGGVNVPDAVGDVIARATAKDPAERYPNAGEMLAAFDQATGNAQGKYVAPAGSSSERINVTQSMGAPQHTPKATADTLHFDGEPAQHITGSSNAVPINDPEHPDSAKSNTTADLAALQTGGIQKALVVVAVLVVLVGIGGALVFMGEDTGDVDATEQAAGETDQPDPPQQDDQAQAAEQADDPADEQADDKLRNDKPGNDKPDDQNAAEVAASDSQPASKDNQTAGDDGESTTSTTNTAPSDNDEPKTAAAAPDKSTSSTTGTSSDRSPTPPDKSPAKAADDRSGSTSSNDSNSDDDSDEDDAPKKFQPKKFEPKTDSDDEPKKFEPRKWR